MVSYQLSAKSLIGKEYPDLEDLKIIQRWDLQKKSITELLNFLQDIWHWPDWGIKIKKRKGKISFELHTGGWSGNEEIIEALAGNFIFWSIWWEKTLRGGHYYFVNINEVMRQWDGKVIKKPKGGISPMG